ncbi:MAG: orotidine-5'-phosphate decarboxylase [bacterium]
MKTNEKIFVRMKSCNTLLCGGLDPDLKKIPLEILEKKISDEDKVLVFLRTVVDITAPHVCVYKVQKAFFDKLGGGHNVLKDIIDYIHTSHQGIPVVVDCKIGDTKNTMEAYIENIFGLLQADGVVANPYMGDDPIMPLAELTDKTIVVLVKTSNPSGSIVQDVLLANGKPLWRYILDMVINRWNFNGNMVPILSSTAEINLAEIRPIIPDNMPVLFAGVGAQGGTYENLHDLLNFDNIGVFVNSSRDILYPPQSQQPWRVAIEQATIELKNALNKARRL